MLLLRGGELRINPLRQLQTVLSRLSGLVDSHVAIKVVMKVVDAEILGDRSPDVGIKVQIIAKVDIVSRERTIYFDSVVSGKIDEVKCLGRAVGGGDVELEDHVDGVFVEARRKVVCGTGSLVDHLVVEVLSITREVAMVS